MRLLDANAQTCAQTNAVTSTLSGSVAARRPHRFDAGSEFNPGRSARLCGSMVETGRHARHELKEGRPV